MKVSSGALRGQANDSLARCRAGLALSDQCTGSGAVGLAQRRSTAVLALGNRR